MRVALSVILVSICFVSGAAAQVPAIEREALIALYTATNGDGTSAWGS